MPKILMYAGSKRLSGLTKTFSVTPYGSGDAAVKIARILQEA